MFSARYRGYALSVLLAIYTFNFLDRQILGILQESIKADLGLSDTQLGALTGFAFAIFYATLGIPIASLADRTSRTRLIAFALSLWSLMTALCGVATSFIMLLCCRIGVGVGEAGCTPPAHSLIADYFPRDKRATAIAIYSLGVPLGGMIGLAAGGWLNELVGWRATFFIVGLPGLLLALIACLTVKELPRGYSDGLVDQQKTMSLREVARFLAQSKAFRFMALGCSLLCFAAYSMTAWNPSFYIRLHGMSSSEIGMALALLVTIPGALGTYFGGVMADRMARKDNRWYLWIPGFAAIIAAPMGLGQFNVPDTALSLALSMGPSFALGVSMGPCFGITQMIVPVRMRASTSAVLLFLINIIGLGLGPFSVGVISDLLMTRGLGPAALGHALSFATMLMIPAGGFLLLAASHLPKALARVEVDMPASAARPAAA
jgi:MFS family permease